ncbi:MAG: low molecular weight phosphotyrosine protein phosphatase [Candidatus Eisenbacteria bacterium]
MSDPDPPFRVLFVCTGNTCRSPLAEVALRRALGEIAARVEVRSAGVAASNGAPASSLSRAVALQHGLDLERHSSRRLDAATLADVDLVLLMDPGDRARVEALAGDRGVEIFALGDFGRSQPAGEAIPDPFGGSPGAYEATLQRIEGHLERVVPYIEAAVREREPGARKPS